MTRDEIIETTRIADVLSSYGVKVDRSGKCCCPLHKEKTPSFKIYEKQHRFYCFGCHEKGTVIDLVMKMEECDFKTAFTSLGGTFEYCDESDESKRIRYERQKKKKERETKDEVEKDFKATLSRTIAICRTWIDTLEPLSDDWCFYKEKLDYLLKVWEDRFLNGEEVNEPNVYRICREVGCHYNR